MGRARSMHEETRGSMRILGLEVLWKETTWKSNT